MRGHISLLPRLTDIPVRPVGQSDVSTESLIHYSYRYCLEQHHEGNLNFIAFKLSITCFNQNEFCSITYFKAETYKNGYSASVQFCWSDLVRGRYSRRVVEISLIISLLLSYSKLSNYNTTTKTMGTLETISYHIVQILCNITYKNDTQYDLAQHCSMLRY